jgi:DNA-binding response OmpR family regulator
MKFQPKEIIKNCAEALTKMHIAVLDDDDAILGMLDRTIRMQGYLCHTFSNVDSFLESMRWNDYDLIVIDWVMPQASGLDIVNVMRNELAATCPIMMISSRDLDKDVAFALYNGIDDYAVKPLRPMEFLARMNKLLRRDIFIQKNPVHDFHPFEINEGLRTIALKGKVVDISPKDFDLALYFFRNLNLKLERRQIYLNVFGQTLLQPSRTLDTHAYQIRRDLQLDGRHGFKLNTVYGVGYQLLRVSSPGEVAPL